MILRKPYAFFIKNFRLMHFIITIIITYLAFKTYPILEFLDGYLANQSSYIGKTWTDQYFNNWMFVLPIIVIIMSIIIMSVLIRKKKPSSFYLVNIFVMIFTMIYYTWLYNTLVTIETQIVNIQVMRAFKDFAVFLLGFQFVAILITFARASGFDVKKFDFGKDLKDLNLTEADREEVEVQINIDTDKVKRKRNRFFRYFKYFYLEHKDIFNVVALIIIIIGTSWGLLNHFVLNKTYLYNNYFSASSFTMKINDCYITTEDNFGNTIMDSGKTLVIVNLNVKTRLEGVTVKLSTYSLAVLLNGVRYYPTIKYRDKTSDLGVTYENQDITNTATNYLLEYEVPTSDLNKSPEFNYVLGFKFGKTIEPNVIHVSLGYNNVDGTYKSNEYEMGKKVPLKNSLASDINIIVNRADINTTFENDYTYCYSNVCFPSKEYLKPELNTNYDKALLKLKISYDANKDMTNLKSVNDLIKYYGKIEYQIGDNEYYETALTLITPKHNDNQNIYYLEVKKEIMNADKIYFVLDIRNYTYMFSIK